jgi:hypothetical protein
MRGLRKHDFLLRAKCSRSLEREEDVHAKMHSTCDFEKSSLIHFYLRFRLHATAVVLPNQAISHAQISTSTFSAIHNVVTQKVSSNFTSLELASC